MQADTNQKKSTFWLAAMAGVAMLSFGAGTAQAIPNLQLYIEGGTYFGSGGSANPAPGGYNDSWAISGTVGLRLWVLADVPAYDVHLVVSYNSPIPAGNNPNLVFTPVRVGDAATTPGIIRNNASAYTGITDTLLPGAVLAGTLNGLLGSLNNNENKYDAATRDWRVFDLGDMATNETNGADLVPAGFTGFGGTASASGYMLNVYDITFNPAALVGQVVNFGVWACEENGCPADSKGKVKYIDMPNSHDAQWLQTGQTVPEPVLLGTLGVGLLALGAIARRRRQAAA